MYIIYNGSSLNCCLWLDANVIIMLASGTLSDQRGEHCASLCTAAFLHMHSVNRVDVITLAPPRTPTHPASVAQQAAAGCWSCSPDSRMTRELSCHIIRPLDSTHSGFLTVSVHRSIFIFLSRGFLFLSHPQQTQRCPTEHHISTKITSK